MPIPTSISQVAARLKHSGYEVFLAGGCVRDLLLGNHPKDFDLATNATPAQVSSLFPKSRSVGAHFGVILVPSADGPIEVATFRTDGSYRNGRHPDHVTFSTAQEDAQRRDFTINGLFMDPETLAVTDYVKGRADLDQRLLRAIGDPHQRFQEDHLRLLRAVRFAAHLDFQIDPLTWLAIQENASSLPKVSAERIRDELSRILTSPNRLRGFDLLVASGLMAFVIPEVLDLQGCEQPPQFHPEGDVFVHTRLMISLLAPDAPLPLVLSVLLHDIAKPATQTRDPDTGRIRFNGHDLLGAEMSETILRRLRYPNEVIAAVSEQVAHHMRFMAVKAMRIAKLKRFMARPHFEQELELHRVDCLSSNGQLDNHSFLLQKQQEFRQAPLIPERLITGNDLVERGWPPGALIGEALTTLQNLQLEGELTTRSQALDWLQTHAPTPEAFAARNSSLH